MNKIKVFAWSSQDKHKQIVQMFQLMLLFLMRHLFKIFHKVPICQLLFIKNKKIISMINSRSIKFCIVKVIHIKSMKLTWLLKILNRNLPKNISSLFQKITNNEMLFYDFSNPKWKDERCSVYNSLFIHLKTAFGRTLNTPDLTRDEK